MLSTWHQWLKVSRLRFDYALKVGICTSQSKLLCNPAVVSDVCGYAILCYAALYYCILQFYAGATQGCFESAWNEQPARAPCRCEPSFG